MIGQKYFLQVDDFKMLEEKPSMSNRRPKKCVTNTKELSATESIASETLLDLRNTDVRLATSLSDASVAHLPGGRTNNKVVSGIVGSDLVISATNAMKNRFGRLHVRVTTYVRSFQKRRLSLFLVVSTK